MPSGPDKACHCLYREMRLVQVSYHAERSLAGRYWGIYRNDVIFDFALIAEIRRQVPIVEVGAPKAYLYHANSTENSQLRRCVVYDRAFSYVTSVETLPRETGSR